MMRVGRLAGWMIIGVVSAGLTGCATRDQFLSMRKELHQVRRVLADTQSDVQTQQRQIQALLGQSETFEQAGVIGGGDRARSLEARVAALEAVIQGRSGPEGAVALPALARGDVQQELVPEGLGASSELASLGGTQPGEDEYRTALALVEQKNCDEAIPRLRSYLQKNPDTSLSDNAQYWIGECYYAQRDFNNAILAFYDVTRRYPKGDKVCAAMLKQGLAFAELGDAADARIVLERLVQAHPECEEVSAARAKLAGLQG